MCALYLLPRRTVLHLRNLRRVQDNRVPPDGQQGQQVRPGRARSPRALDQPPQRARHHDPISQAAEQTLLSDRIYDLLPSNLSRPSMY